MPAAATIDLSAIPEAQREAVAAVLRERDALQEANKRLCPSSDNLGRLSAFQTGGSGSPLIDVTRSQFRGASAGRAWFSV